MLAFEKSVDDTLMTRFTGGGQIPKMNLTVWIGVRINADMRFGFIGSGRVTAVAFFAGNTGIFVYR
jgi:hypothetical protein